MRIEKDTLGVMAIMSVLGAVGCVFFLCAIADIDIAKLGMPAFSGFLTGFSGLFFALFLVWHCNGLHK